MAEDFYVTILTQVESQQSSISSLHIALDGKLSGIHNLLSETTAPLFDRDAKDQNSYHAAQISTSTFIRILALIRSKGWTMIGSNAYLNSARNEVVKTFYFEKHAGGAQFRNGISHVAETTELNRVVGQKTVEDEAARKQSVSSTSHSRRSSPPKQPESHPAEQNTAGVPKKQPANRGLGNWLPGSSSSSSSQQQQQQQQQQHHQQQSHETLERQRSTPPPPPAATVAAAAAAVNERQQASSSYSNQYAQAVAASNSNRRTSDPPVAEPSSSHVQQQRGPAPPPPPAAHSTQSPEALQEDQPRTKYSPSNFSAFLFRTRSSTPQPGQAVKQKNDDFFKRMKLEQEAEKKKKEEEEAKLDPVELRRRREMATLAKEHETSKTNHFSRLGANFVPGRSLLTGASTGRNMGNRSGI